MQVGDTTTIGELVFTFRGVREVAGPNYRAARGTIDVTENGRRSSPCIPRSAPTRPRSRS
jgi:cytochrome c-type biogenesis protein CcmF